MKLRWPIFFFFVIWLDVWSSEPDPQLTRQWAIFNPIESVDTGLLRAINEFGPGDTKIKVAVIDTGSRVLPDLAANLWSPTGETIIDETSAFGVNFFNPSQLPIDRDGHGTHIASIIGAVSNNGLGMMGMAQNVELMILQHLGPQRYGIMDDAAKAIHFALDHGARIINCSWGGESSSRKLDEALARAQKEGVLIVAGAGNDKTNNDLVPFYPANSAFANIISVAAIQRNAKLYQEPSSYWGSNIGPNSVHLAAPGQDILGYGATGELEYWSGTSQAAGVISGIAAFILSHEPNLNAEQLKERLMKTGRPLRSLRGKIISGKTVNAYYALKNEPHPKDADDPIHWRKYDYHKESQHPYLADSDETTTVHIPGAKRIAVHFKRLILEQRDLFTLLDVNGEFVESYTGHLQNEYSAIVTGDTINLRFTSDSSIQRWGYLIDHIAYE